MEQLDRLRERIETTEDLRGIVRTMKALSAATIRQYEQAAESVERYSETLSLGLQVALRTPPEEAELRAPAAGPPQGPEGFIVVGSDHGLCGRFNDQMAEQARRLRAGGRGPLLAIGARVAALMEEEPAEPFETLTLPGSSDGLSAVVEEVLLRLDRWRSGRSVERVRILYNRREASQLARPHSATLLPVAAEWLEELERRPWPTRQLPQLGLERRVLLPMLLQEQLFIGLYRALAQSLASEHASRLAAMQSAERNIKDRLEEMRGDFRHLRQQAITEELIDIVSGFKAMRRGEPEEPPEV